MPDDHLDRIRHQWHRERPDLDTQAMGILGRIYRLAAAAGSAMGQTFEGHGLKGYEFDVLATLRRNGEPFQMLPGALAADLLITSGGMTARLDRLEQCGFIERTVKPTDHRARLISLTEHGLAVVDAALDAAVETQQRLVTGMTEDRRQLVDDLLRELLALVTHEASLPPPHMAAPDRLTAGG